MHNQNQTLEPTNIQRARWAKEALTVFTKKTYNGDRPDTMDPSDLETAIADLICDLLHFANYHPRLDAVAIHSHSLSMFQEELEEPKVERDVGASHSALMCPNSDVFDRLLNIKRLAEKSGDHEADPFALLDLIQVELRIIISVLTLTPKE